MNPVSRNSGRSGSARLAPKQIAPAGAPRCGFGGPAPLPAAAWRAWAAAAFLAWAGAVTTAHAQDAPALPEPDKLTLADLKVPDATPEFLDAYRLFLKAGVSDKGKRGYAGAVVALDKVGKSTSSQGLKLHCLFLTAFAQFLDGKFAESAQSATSALELAKTCMADNASINGLVSLKTAIEAERMKELPDLTAFLKLGKDGGALAADLFAIYRAREDLDAKLDARWQKNRGVMDAKIADWAAAEKFTPEQVEKVRQELEQQFRPQGSVDLDAVENELVKISLQMLVE
ncbi:MAG: hypothetical protein A3K18_25260 [Lentisphaerae bacterium RIFOXYA12_64_32]|nr:MAG: hypothetical protein A3K18_25260 [Lentisphaerae bacterium RIFOXYA12_64_32]